MSSRAPRIASLLLVALVAAAVTGCPRTPRSLGPSLESPPPPPPPPNPWKFFSDQERIVDLAVTADAVWAIAQTGVLRWTRPGGQVWFATGPGAPGDDATAIAVATDGTVYVGLKDAIVWRRPQPTAQWQRLDAAPLPAGVTALAPRRAGGVWVGMQRGLGWMHNGRLRLHSKIHTVRDMVVDPAGRLWAATARRGLITIEGDKVVEHTTVSGLCANEVRAVAVGGNQVAVVCNTPQPLVALRVRNTWYPYRLERGGAAIQAVQWVTGGWVVRSTGGWWRVVEQPAGTPDNPGTGVAARLVALDPGRMGPAPALIQPVRAKSAPAPAAAGAEDAPPSADADQAAPVVPTPPPPVEELLLNCERAPAATGTAANAPALRLLPETILLPEDVEVTVWRVEPDGFAWFGLAYRGVLGQKGQATQRYTSQSLVPRHASTQMVVDSQGRAIIPSIGPYVIRWDGSGWARRPVAPADSSAQALAAAPDDAGGAWLLIGYPPPTPVVPVVDEADPVVDGIAGAGTAPPAQPTVPELALVRIEKSRIQRLARQPVLGIDNPLRSGRLWVTGIGEALFPLFFESDRGRLRAAGLGRIPVSHDALQRWQARRTRDEVSVDGTPLLPDGWVNDLARTDDGTVYLGTNAGLVKVKGDAVRVYDENDFMDSEVITALALDAQGTVWAGTLEGLGRLQNDQWVAVKSSTLPGRISTMVFAPDGALWAGTDRGVFVNRAPTTADDWRTVEVRPGETTRDVRSVVHGADGSIWILAGQGVFFLPKDAK